MNESNEQWIAIIPARGGSKGIPRKNLIDVAGKPLIAWTIDAARESGLFSHIFVSSDDDEILSVAEALGAQPIKRPAAFSSDTAVATDALMHALEEIDNRGVIAHVVAYLQPTSPLRTARHLTEAAAYMKETGAAALIGMRKAENSVLKMFTVNDDGTIEGIRNNAFPFMNRQALPPVLRQSGALYFIRIEDAKRVRNFFVEGNTVPFVMSDDECFDLDTPDQLPELEEKLRRLGEKK